MATSAQARWLGLAMLSLGVAMIVVDLSIISVSIPTIIDDLGIDYTAVEWVNSIYGLVFAALLITFGRLGDLLGRRRVYIGGLVLFAVASVLAAVAPTGSALIAARVLQGVGGAAISPATLSIVSAEFQGRERGIAFGIYGSVIGGVAALGPAVGGWLTTNASWRWAFGINPFVAVIAILGTLTWVRESRDERAQPRFDLLGAVLTAIGFGGVVFGFIEGSRYGWLTPAAAFELGPVRWPADAPLSVVAAGFLVAAAALLLFTARELSRERRGDVGGLFRFGLLRHRGYAFGSLTVMVLSMGEYGLLFVLPLFLQGMRGYSAFQTGLFLVAVSIGSFIAGPSAGALAIKVGAKVVVATGMVLEAAGVLWISQLFSPGVSGLAFVVPLAVYGAGTGLAVAQLTNVALSDVPVSESGAASGGTSVLRQIGTAMGLALLGTILAVGLGSGTHDRLAAGLAATDLPAAARQQIATSVAAAVQDSYGQTLPEILGDPRLPVAAQPAIEAAVPAAFTDAARTAAYAAAAFMLLGLAFSLFVPGRARRAADVAGSGEGSPVPSQAITERRLRE
jgi:EmrB/QacA subfamily drug resistance transporter